MPLRKYDSELGNAAKTYRALIKRYGEEKGRRVFYALVNKRKKARRG